MKYMLRVPLPQTLVPRGYEEEDMTSAVNYMSAPSASGTSLARVVSMRSPTYCPALLLELLRPLICSVTVGDFPAAIVECARGELGTEDSCERTSENFLQFMRDHHKGK